ncbi:MAG: hypothetical protein WCA51_07420 [Dehalococcoidia bacterium]
MGSNDAFSDRQMLERIKDQLEHQGKTLRLRFYLSIAITFIVLSLSVLLASLSLGKAMDLRWLISILLIGGALIIYWAYLDFNQNYRKSFAVSGSILLVAGALTGLALPTLIVVFPCIESKIRIIGSVFAIFLIFLGMALIILAPRRIRKSRA